MDYSHHSTILVPHEFKEPIHVIGVGATGSWAALLMAKLGLRKLSFYDFDVVEEHNVANQAYGVQDIGKLKVDALRDELVSQLGTEVDAICKAEKVKSLFGMFGIIVNLVDSMSARKELFATCLHPMAKLYVETRLAVDGGRIYIINPMNPEHRAKYQATLYDDGVAEVSACGTSQTVAPTAMLLGAKLVWEILKHHEGNDKTPFFGEILFDVYGNEIMTEW